jgi:hypothetical protein
MSDELSNWSSIQAPKSNSFKNALYLEELHTIKPDIKNQSGKNTKFTARLLNSTDNTLSDNSWKI